MNAITLTAPILDEGMRMTPGELIDEFYERLADLNADMRNLRIYVAPEPGAISIDRRRRRVTVRVEYAEKKKYRGEKERR